MDIGVRQPLLSVKLSAVYSPWYRKVCLPTVSTDYTTLDVNAAVGLKSLFSVSSGVQLSPHAQANLTATWQPDEGVGLQVSCGWLCG